MQKRMEERRRQGGKLLLHLLSYASNENELWLTSRMRRGEGGGGWREETG